MFAELAISEQLLKAKKKLCTKATIEELDKLWFKNPDATESEIKESDEQMKKCHSLSSAWVLRKTEPITDHFRLEKVLGNPGQYGVVKRGIELKNDKCWAVKIVSKRRFRDRKLTHAFFEDLRAEVYLMSVTSEHPNIIEFHQVFEDISNMYIVMTHCSGGELFDRIQSDEGFTEHKAAKLFRQMVSSVYYLHQLGIAHCDLKPENFLFREKDSKSNKQQNNDDMVLIDFGMAKIVEWRKYYKRMNGTPYYIAPEVLGGKYNESCDMWSLGVILFIMIFGFPPFFDSDERKNSREQSDAVIYKKIKKGFVPKVQKGYGAWFPIDHPVSSHCRDLISRMLRTSVADRITSEEALEHPWLQLDAPHEQSNLHEQRSKSAEKNPIILRSVLLFKHHSGLQGEILRLLKECNYLNSSQIESVKSFFKLADKNQDGLISREELFQALKEIDTDLTADDIQSILRSIDANNDGYMDYDELLTSRINRKLQSKEARLRKVFKALDLDDNGKISSAELKAALESVSAQSNMTIDKSQCDKLISEVDKNNDGEIDFEEFISMFMDQNGDGIDKSQLAQSMEQMTMKSA